MSEKTILQEEILANALIIAKKSFYKYCEKKGMQELFDLDITGYCYDQRGNMTFKVSMEAQDGIEDDYFDNDDSESEFDDND